MESIGRMFKTAGGKASYEIESFEPEQVIPVSEWIQEHFGFEPKGLPIAGLDQIFWTLEKGGVEIMVGWDNWSGLFVMAVDAAGEAWVEQIGTFLDGIGGDLSTADN